MFNHSDKKKEASRISPRGGIISYQILSKRFCDHPHKTQPNFSITLQIVQYLITFSVFDSRLPIIAYFDNNTSYHTFYRIYIIKGFKSTQIVFYTLR